MGLRLSFWRGRRVLITGATGFLGSWVARRAAESGARIAALVIPKDPLAWRLKEPGLRGAKILIGRLEDAASLSRAIKKARPQLVFHLGAQTLVGPALQDPVATFEANIRGSYQLLELCRARGIPLVVASSDKAYGEGRPRAYTEEMALEGRHPYDVSKSCTDLLAKTYHETYGLPLAIVRCGNLYGGGDMNWSRIVPGAIRWLLRGQRPILRSDGRSVRDYLHVDDAARGYLMIAERLGDERVRGEAFNLGANQPRTVLALVERVARLLGRADLRPVIERSARAEIRSQRLSPAKARRVLGWSARLSLDEGLREAIAWYRERLR